MAWTADELVTAVRMRARIPTGASALSDTQILSIADDEILGVVVPLMLRHGGNRIVRHEDQAIAAGTASYRIPQRAVAGTNRVVCYVTPDGDEIPLPEVPLEERGEWKTNGSSWWQRGAAHVIEGDVITLLPTPTASQGSLRVKYQWRPGRLVLVASTSSVSSISNAYRYNSSFVPAGWTTSTLVDVIEARPNFDLLLHRQTPTAVMTVSTPYVELAELADSGGIAAGHRSLSRPEMYVAATGESPVVQLPDVLHPALTSLVTATVLDTLGDVEAGKVARDDAARKLEAAASALAPRGRGVPQRVVSYSTPLRWGRR